MDFVMNFHIPYCILVQQFKEILITPCVRTMNIINYDMLMTFAYIYVFMCMKSLSKQPIFVYNVLIVVSGILAPHISVHFQCNKQT